MTQTGLPGLAAATRVDGTNGTTERIEFRGPEDDRIFSSVYLPQSAPRAGALICPPLHGEFTRNYRREVLLARRLADQGIAVERFHYRGTGNSDGDGIDLNFDSMRQDAASCLDHLRTEAGVEKLFIVGTRWGALTAASVGAIYPQADLVLWEPLLEASRFFRDAFRTKLVLDRKEGAESPATRIQLLDRIQQGQGVDIVGHTIEVRLYQSSVDRTVEDELGPSPRSILVLQIGRSKTVRPDLARQASRWRSWGLRVDIEVVDGDETWWLSDVGWKDEAIQPTTIRLLEATSLWIADRISEGTPNERNP